MNFHVNPATGIVNECSPECCLGLPLHKHFDTKSEALTDFRHLINSTFNDHGLFSADPLFKDSLQKAVSRGFSIPQETGSPAYYDFINVLKTPTVIQHLANTLNKNHYDASKTAKALEWALRGVSLDEGLSVYYYAKSLLESRTLSPEVYSQVLQNLALAEASPETLVNVSSKLWVFNDSPFHNAAKKLLIEDFDKITGYTPQPTSINWFGKHDKASLKMNVYPYELPDNVIAYDIETDTSNGRGLCPTKSQITEIVLSSKDNSWVLSGDEKKILESFRDVCDSLNDSYILSGWNNRCFDNIFLQTRAEVHSITGWNGKLIEDVNFSDFEPCSPLGKTYRLEWHQPDGKIIYDADVFQAKIQKDLLNNSRGVRGLKSFVETLGMKPIKVDRTKLHELSDEDRANYVLSDGISTLRAHQEVFNTSAWY